MTVLLDALHALGTASVRPFWLPLLAWTLLILPAWAALARWRSAYPLVQYRLRQALLAALPLGVGAAALVDVTGLLSGWTGHTPLDRLSFVLLPGVDAAAGAPASGDLSGLDWRWTQAVGGVTLGAAGWTLVRLGRFARDAFLLARIDTLLDARLDAALQGHANRWAQRLGIDRPVAALVTDRTVIPLVAIGRRPSIIVPSRLLADSNALRMTLMHECVHVRRYDDLAHVAEQFVAACFAVHPGVALLVRSIDRYRERACDAAVLAGPRVRRAPYARLLLSFADATLPRGHAALPLAESRPSLKDRLLAMRTLNPTSRPKYVGTLLAAVVLVFTLGIVGCSELVSSEEAGEQRAQAEQALSGKGPSEVFVVVEDQPELIGGMAALQKEVRYPESAKKAGIEGRVIVQFVVDEQGNVVDPKVTRGVHPLLNKEVVRVISAMKFKPGKQRGKPVKVRMSLPITFRLQGKQSESPSAGDR